MHHVNGAFVQSWYGMVAVLATNLLVNYFIKNLLVSKTYLFITVPRAPQVPWHGSLLLYSGTVIIHDQCKRVSNHMGTWWGGHLRKPLPVLSQLDSAGDSEDLHSFCNYCGSEREQSSFGLALNCMLSTLIGFDYPLIIMPLRKNSVLIRRFMDPWAN